MSGHKRRGLRVRSGKLALMYLRISVSVSVDLWVDLGYGYDWYDAMCCDMKLLLKYVTEEYQGLLSSAPPDMEYNNNITKQYPQL